jgi:hypothetical protein
VKLAVPNTPKNKPDRPRKGEQRPQKDPRRLEQQLGVSLEAMLAALPGHCAVGAKRNAKGQQESWIGYKLHLDVADGGIPVSCLLTAASLHDSQAAIPLASMTATRTTNLYDVMDRAYDAPEIRAHSRSLATSPSSMSTRERRPAERSSSKPRKNAASGSATDPLRRSATMSAPRSSASMAASKMSWRPNSARARQRQSNVPSDVWHCRTHRRSALRFVT